MADEMTCGKGLANNAVLPAKLGQITASMAQILDVHMDALDRDDEDARIEHDAYSKLVRDQRRVADELQSIAEEMTSHEGLPMGRHDQGAMTSPRALQAFERFVTIEQQLLEMLQERLQQDRAMFEEMRRADPASHLQKETTK